MARAEPRRFPPRRLGEPRIIAAIGIGLGLLAVWLALPPIAARAVLWPVFVGLLAVAAGIWSASRGAGRVGWGAVASGLLGVAFGIFATRARTTNLEGVFVWSTIFASTLRYATPLTFAAIGGMFSERSGVVNIGLEGMMLMGAFFGVWGADKTDSWLLGILIAMLAGVALALVHAIFTISFRAEQIVTGTAVNFLALGITGYVFVSTYGAQGAPTNIPEIPDVSIGFLKNVYFLGPVFGTLNLMIWLSFALLIVSHFVMFKTTIGLRIRSVGEHPRAADTVGISVYRTRYAAVATSGALAALGGAYLSLGFVHTFDQNITGGRGFIALAALIFGKWRPFGAFSAALLFGFSSALGDHLPDFFKQGSALPQLFNTLPYVLTIVAVAGVIGRSIPPAAIGRPYTKQ
ncbi:MAG: ral nucleoside transport system permease protein [Gaiellaceae bacterium]|jgi:simple sugar transport system permease protein|nr:ral nucleoside transport system permease protein [Gaiellaceae bacterium]